MKNNTSAKGLLSFFSCLIVGGLINYGLQSLFDIREDTPEENICSVVGLFVAIALFYLAEQIYKKIMAKRRAGVTSLKDYFFHKENIHEVNFKAQFANFRKRHLQEMDADHWLLQGIHFDEIVNSVEERILLIASNPQNVKDGIDYESVTIAEILNEVLNRINYGSYIYRGIPSMTTSSFITFYRKILEIEYKYGNVTKEQKDSLIDNMEEIIENNG